MRNDEDNRITIYNYCRLHEKNRSEVNLAHPGTTPGLQAAIGCAMSGCSLVSGRSLDGLKLSKHRLVWEVQTTKLTHRASVGKPTFRIRYLEFLSWQDLVLVKAFETYSKVKFIPFPMVSLWPYVSSRTFLCVCGCCQGSHSLTASLLAVSVKESWYRNIHAYVMCI